MSIPNLAISRIRANITAMYLGTQEKFETVINSGVSLKVKRSRLRTLYIQMISILSITINVTGLEDLHDMACDLADEIDKELTRVTDELLEEGD